MNVEIGTEAGATPRKGIDKWDFRCSVVNHLPCGAGRWEEDAVVATVATTHRRIGERMTGILKCKQRSHLRPSFLTLFYMPGLGKLFRCDDFSTIEYFLFAFGYRPLSSLPMVKVMQ